MLKLFFVIQQLLSLFDCYIDSILCYAREGIFNACILIFVKKQTFVGCNDLCAARCSSVVRAFAHGAMGRRINLSWRSEM